VIVRHGHGREGSVGWFCSCKIREKKKEVSL
jgi:hypothetical protein